MTLTDAQTAPDGRQEAQGARLRLVDPQVPAGVRLESRVAARSPRVLALDVASCTGWATNCLGGHVEAGTQEFGLRRGESAGMRYRRFRLWLQEQFAELQPEVVAYEAPVAHHSGAHAAELAYALISRVQEECETAALDCVGLAPSALKRYATGKGVAEKGAMVEAARERFPSLAVEDHNAADALLLLAWALDGFPEAAPAKRRQRAAARKGER